MKQVMPLPLFLEEVKAQKATIGFTYDFTHENMVERKLHMLSEIETVLKHLGMKVETATPVDMSDAATVGILTGMMDEDLDNALLTAGSIALCWNYDMDYQRENDPGYVSAQVTAWPLNDKGKITLGSDHVFKINFLNAKE